MILADRVSFAYPQGPQVFQDFTWRVEPGEFWAVIGPSGCGKSTLLALAAGLRSPAAGRILVGDRPMDGPRRSTGLILQDHGMLPWATVRQNVELGLRIRGIPAGERRSAVQSWLARMGLEKVADRYPQQVSGGQRQRAAIARTLATQPDLLLMDEPFSSLDALTREEMQNLVLELGQENRLTVLLVTHNVEEAAFLGRKILVLTHPPIAHPEIVENPGAGRLDYRAFPAYFETARRTRQRIMEMQRDPVGPV